VLDAIETLRDEWRGRADKKHWCLAPADIVPTIIAGGVWTVTYPPHCPSLRHPVPAGERRRRGTAKAVEAEVKDWIDAAANADPWLREHPLKWDWMEDIVPAEMPADHPLVGIVLDGAAALGRTGMPRASTSWHDAPISRVGARPDAVVRPRRRRQCPHG